MTVYRAGMVFHGKSKGGIKMKKTRDKPAVSVKVTFTEGYEQRFTKAILKIYAKRMEKQEKDQEAAG